MFDILGYRFKDSWVEHKKTLYNLKVSFLFLNEVVSQYKALHPKLNTHNGTNKKIKRTYRSTAATVIGIGAGIFTDRSKAVLLLWIINVIFVLCLLCLSARLFIVALWAPAGKGLTSWLSFVMSCFEFVTFPLVSWVRCGIWLHRFLIFVLFLTLMYFNDQIFNKKKWWHIVLRQIGMKKFACLTIKFIAKSM